MPTLSMTMTMARVKAALKIQNLEGETREEPPSATEITEKNRHFLPRCARCARWLIHTDCRMFLATPASDWRALIDGIAHRLAVRLEFWIHSSNV
jgi:hypothetical protein